MTVPKPKTFEDNVGVRIIRLAEVFTRLAKIGVEQPWNLRNTDLRILNTLDGSDSVAISEIARRTHVDKAWISRSVRQLEDAGLIEAFTSGEDLHTYVASHAFGLPIDQVDPDLRRRVKAMSYGLAYGLSAFGLANQLKIAPAEAREQMDAYFERFGGVRDYLRDVVEQARQTGYTETIMGRRRYLPDLTSDNRQRREMAERMALNAPIQGSAADIIKVAMLNVDRALRGERLKSRMLLQVHDELVFEVAPGERETLEALVRREMGGAYTLAVPLDVSIGIGKTWDEAGH